MATYTIDYIEFWAVKHCNLNCKGCSSCSPIAEKWFLDIERLKNDLKRLSDLKIEIKNIAVLGGEPLLHPHIDKIFDVVKEVYPECSLELLTNGLLLPKMPETFWLNCEKNKVKIKVTCFPIMNQPVRDEIEQLLNRHKLSYHLTDKKRFNKILVLNNQEPIEKVIENCGCNNAYNLLEGNVSRCTVPMAVLALNEVYGAGFIEEGRLDIYHATAGEIIKFLRTPNESCRNCTSRTRKVLWEKASDSPLLSDWVIGDEERPL